MTDDLRAAVAWTGDAVEIIDQTRLPAEELVLRLTTPEEVVAAIARLAVRGAPAIGICGAFGVVLAADQLGEEATAERLTATAAAVRAARPTAVNLAWAVDRVLAAARRAPDGAALRGAVEAEALAILAEDREACRLIGEHGRAELSHAGRLLTLCNTGRLATGGWGTALGVVYAKAAAGEPIEVLACETRPLLQGARLTAWELQHAGIAVTVLTEGAAAARLARGDVDAVVVGADRVAANGDTANKIGTYALAIAAHHHGVPFYVAVPRSTLDAATADGAAIDIEQRAGSEVRIAAGLGDDVAVWNPAFDVTPAALITAIISDAGVLRPPFEATIADALGAAPARA
ncbi:MAG TPA: S-methyl-5-thioribose-1-phosphate isomerase [Solirubrobacteraceae bacterium]|nr:S-methyl-5-thioribose-1-phosphate isomerase [Solirubrobacteraceae bacterium]